MEWPQKESFRLYYGRRRIGDQAPVWPFSGLLFLFVGLVNHFEWRCSLLADIHYCRGKVSGFMHVCESKVKVRRSSC